MLHCQKTLIVGVDIAKEKHHARAFDYRGVEYGKRLEFENNREGMEKFLAWAMDLMRKNKKDHLMVGMEPTGHYWLCFAQYLKDNDVKVVLVNPFHVKRSKELDDNSPTKSDHKDPKTIAMLVKDGRYVEPNIPEGIYAELRAAMDIRERLNKQLGMIKNQVARWLDIYFPEFNTVFADWEGKAALVTLKEFPTPEKIAKKSMEEILSCWKKEVQRAIGQKRAIELLNAARKSIGRREGIKMAEYELKSTLEQYELLRKQLEEVDKEIKELVMQVPGVNEMLKIKGIGINTVAGFISEVGDIERYEHPKQIQKLAGLNLVENSSGKHKGETVISKRGRRRLRSILFKAIMPIVAKNKEFQELHKYYTTRAQNPLKKKQSLIALCCKMIRIFYVILRKGVKYDPVKMLKDIKRPPLQEVA
ncbi:IS110 family RNA-guided transposase [Caldanaerobius polysaccharolyticus]|uniref:IS110 family transposase n=1 Tax=Caldanaerobius polysaccharolyticus TaxID=44256 RepID=UPI0004790BD3|nr:IS110 family transposase [Caldanaerobius polysaccharolyticus]